MGKIKFGTDGWRGVIAEDFTFDSVRIVAQAIADYLKEETRSNRRQGVVVGYDNRFLAEKYALLIAEVLSGNGIKVILSDKSVPSPCVSFTVVERECDGGVMVTASHNPPQFSGIKFKAAYGGSATEEITRKIEKNLYRRKIPESINPELIIEEDLIPPYLARLKSFIDFGLIKDTGLKIVADPMYGVASNYIEEMLKDTNCNVSTLHARRDPLFGGLNPEPIGEYLGELKKKVKEMGADIGLATDGDADRIGVVDDEGNYLTPHLVFPLLLLYLVREKGWMGKVVQTISLGYLSERIAKKCNLGFQEVPIGFKYVADLMLKENILIGGEESGGYGYQGYIPERDGILSSLFFVEMLARTKKRLSTLLREMEGGFGRSFYKRVDFELADTRWEGLDKKEFVQELYKRAPKKLLDIPVKEIKTYDGIEYILEDDSWLLLRPSGTEPVLRVYVETDEPGKTEKLLEISKGILYNA
ncbi:MAG: phosphoglucomutase/phosphomannomutase family protein [bacterium]